MGRVSRRPEVVPEKDKVLSDQGRRPKSENRFATFATPFVRREKSRTSRGPWCLDPPMLGDPKMRPTELRMTPAAPLDEDSRAIRSRSHTRTSVQQHSIPTVIRSARTVSQVRPDAARGRAQSSGERAHLVVVYISEHLRVITVNQLCRPSRLFSRMVSTRHRCANVAHNSVLQNVL